MYIEAHYQQAHGAFQSSDQTYIYIYVDAHPQLGMLIRDRVYKFTYGLDVHPVVLTIESRSIRLLVTLATNHRICRSYHSTRNMKSSPIFRLAINSSECGYIRRCAAGGQLKSTIAHLEGTLRPIPYNRMTLCDSRILV